MSSLTFDRLRAVNIARCENVFHPIGKWTPERWSNAMAGECGEVCNAVKKLNRLEDGTNTYKDPQTETECLDAIGDELADLIIYADLLAARLGIDLGEAVIDKFNAVSILRKTKERLP
jgi:NTP pyrophosphatase (non-canonical NTP hydrolase)